MQLLNIMKPNETLRNINITNYTYQTLSRGNHSREHVMSSEYYPSEQNFASRLITLSNALGLTATTLPDISDISIHFHFHSVFVFLRVATYYANHITLR